MALNNPDLDKYLNLRAVDLNSRHNLAIHKAAEIKDRFEALGMENPRVLMIDDEPDAIELAEMTIGYGLGYDFKSLIPGQTTNGHYPQNDPKVQLFHLIAGTEKNAFTSADLIICDLDMPGLNGRELVEQVTYINKISHSGNRKLNPGCQIVFFTAQSPETIQTIFGQPIIESPEGLLSVANHSLLRKNGGQNDLEDMVNRKLEDFLNIREGKVF